MNHQQKIKIGILFIALSSLVSSILLVLDKDEDNASLGRWYYVSMASLYENRFAELKNYLPANSVVGYITDIQPDENTRKGYGEYLTRYYLTQYVLSPAIIADEPTRPLVIGNFQKKVDLSRISREYHLTLIREFGDGVMLFRNEKVK